MKLLWEQLYNLETWTLCGLLPNFKNVWFNNSLEDHLSSFWRERKKVGTGKQGKDRKKIRWDRRKPHREEEREDKEGTSVRTAEARPWAFILSLTPLVRVTSPKHRLSPPPKKFVPVPHHL